MDATLAAQALLRRARSTEPITEELRREIHAAAARLAEGEDRPHIDKSTMARAINCVLGARARARFAMEQPS